MLLELILGVVTGLAVLMSLRERNGRRFAEREADRYILESTLQFRHGMELYDELDVAKKQSDRLAEASRENRSEAQRLDKLLAEACDDLEEAEEDLGDYEDMIETLEECVGEALEGWEASDLLTGKILAAWERFSGVRVSPDSLFDQVTRAAERE